MGGFLDVLRSGRVLLMDGAMGTELQKAGLGSNECGELWNLTHSDRVRAVHQAYGAAGARVWLTNTFQANRVALARSGSRVNSNLFCEPRSISPTILRLASLSCGRAAPLFPIKVLNLKT